jgi:hypothetical protein
MRIKVLKRKGGKMKLRAVKSFTINRDVWARGKDYGRLLFADDTMCCLGIHLKACRMPKKYLLGNDMPGEAFSEAIADGKIEEVPKELKWLLLNDDSEASAQENVRQLMRTNDSSEITPKLREQAIAKLFKRHNIQVRFK